MFKTFILSLTVILTFSFLITVEASAPVTKTFDITGYYSPIEGQNTYFKGSYMDDVLLNGFGFSTASGSAPYKDIVAAPNSFEFGTILYIDGFGWKIVEDRGGAIVAKGDREDYDRLDMWFGKGENALKNALSWGRGKAEVTIFSSELIKLNKYSFDTDLDYGVSGRKVVELQEYLKALGFLNHSVTGKYFDLTEKAVLEFQLWKGIINDENALGAGRLGPGTRYRLNNFAEIINNFRKIKKEANLNNSPYKQSQYLIEKMYNTVLSEGDSNYFVFMLQSRLKRLGYFTHPYTTYDFKTKTKEAILNYQLAKGIISSDSDKGAGVFGPATSRQLRKDVLKLS